MNNLAGYISNHLLPPLAPSPFRPPPRVWSSSARSRRRSRPPKSAEAVPRRRRGGHGGSSRRLDADHRVCVTVPVRASRGQPRSSLAPPQAEQTAASPCGGGGGGRLSRHICDEVISLLRIKSGRTGRRIHLRTVSTRRRKASSWIHMTAAPSP